MTRRLPWLTPVVVLSLAVCGGAVSAAPSGPSDPRLSVPSRVYQVNKRVSEFPEAVDLSTPETACAALFRLMASGHGKGWVPLSVRELRPLLERMSDREVPAEEAQRYLNARLVEVRIYEARYAVVLAEVGGPDPISARVLRLEEDRWLNRGEGCHQTLEAARERADGRRWRYYDPPPLAAPADAAAFLAPFVDFLKAHAEEPHSFVMRALAAYPLVIMGEVHHRPLYWQFNSSLVRDPEFPKHVGAIYVEMPSHDQGLIDRFLAGDRCDPQWVVQMLRDVLDRGWPDQAMLDFFEAVWMVNQTLAPEQRLRIVLVDMPRPWSKIEKPEDWTQYEKVSRDQQMADNILADLRAHPKDGRHGLFIVGFGHGYVDLTRADWSPAISAAWHLSRALGKEKVYSIFPHHPVMTNNGEVSGRLMWGLFDSAFAALGNKPSAFSLTSGPFGEQRFDALPEQRLAGTYRDGYHAYLYLGPLEYETFSPLIAGFYTDEFVSELDRRQRVMYGRGWVESGYLKKLDAELLIARMRRLWGAPRRDWSAKALGPVDAWRLGSSWQEVVRSRQYAAALARPEEVRQTAQALLEDLQQADYQQFLSGRLGWEEFPTAWSYTAQRAPEELMAWMCETFSRNPIVKVAVGAVFEGEDGLPTVPYTLVLKDGKALRGNLPFSWEFDTEPHWQSRHGLDWHLQKEPRSH